MPSFLSVPVPVTLVLIKCGIQNRAVRGDSPVLQGITVVYMQHLFHFPILYAGGIRIPGSWGCRKVSPPLPEGRRFYRGTWRIPWNRRWRLPSIPAKFLLNRDNWTLWRLRRPVPFFLSICRFSVFRYIPLLSWSFAIKRWNMPFPISGASMRTASTGKVFTRKLPKGIFCPKTAGLNVEGIVPPSYLLKGTWQVKRGLWWIFIEEYGKMYL